MRTELWRRVAVIVAATAGASAVFGGVALADGHDDDDAVIYAHKYEQNYEHNDEHNYKRTGGGSGGAGGRAQSTCAAPLGVSAGVFGQGDPVDQCNVHGGTGGNGGDADY